MSEKQELLINLVASLQSLIPDEGLNDYGKGYKKGIQDCFNLVKKTLLESPK
ncbi:hypothetical protein [Solobacterium moorei]|uniref:hypothetical protein n=1 Tax=Solobacterium moorei TaxID=102148 RepID=UPI000401FC77|nr:hypothetical protein [Solobacterium moorei]BET22530.1 hypothetical protein RGT18_21180 [Solobacterium moorei]